MSDFDDALDELYPNEEQRRERRAKLFARIDAFLDEGLIESDGGWAAVEREHIDALYEIFGELIDLKVERDPDGDRTIEFSLCNRRTHKMTSLYQTYRPRNSEELSDGDILDWMTNASREASYALAVAQRFSEDISFELQTFNMIRERRRKFQELVEAVEEDMRTLPFDEASDRLLKAMKDHSHTEYSSFAKAQAILAERFPDLLERDVEEILRLMAPYTSDADDGYHMRVRVPRTRMSKIWGVAFGRDPRVAGPANEHIAEGRRIRALRNAK